MQHTSPQPDALPPLEKYRAILAEAEQIHGVSLWRDAGLRLRSNRSAMASLIFLIMLGMLSLFAPLLPLQPPLDQNPEFRRLQPPELTPRPLPDFEDVNTANRNAYITQSWGEKRGVVVRWMIGLRMAIFGDWTVPSVCGTDALGRDMLSRLFWGSRVSLIVGIVATLVSLIIGVTYGAIAGYVGGWLDDVMMRIVDILYSIPFIFVVIFIITILADETWKANLERFGVDRIMIFYLLIGAIFWLTMSRVVRGQVISLRSEQFVEAARVIGASRGRIIFMHLVPNILGVVIIYLTLTIPSVMLFEAFLSFLGLGVEAPDISWGSLANEGMKSITPIRTFWWLVVFPGLALAGTLYALNFLGDGLRDAMDPRLKNT
ncbi:MAG: ABC transporter permease [Pirellulales bacterium]